LTFNLLHITDISLADETEITMTLLLWMDQTRFRDYLYCALRNGILVSFTFNRKSQHCNNRTYI